jgi:deoxyribose-phosphate aldolase
MSRDSLADVDLAPTIDHSLLNPQATDDYVRQWCAEADRFQFASVCVYPSQVRLATECLHGKRPAVSTVIGFPTGATTASVKLYEALEAVENGATELDVMINLAQLKQGQTNEVYRAIAEICEESNVLVKAIIETNLLTPEELPLAVNLCIDAGAGYIMTGTGWNGGVTLDTVRQLKSLAKEQIGIKAAAGIKEMDFAIDLIVEGATRLGTSYAIAMLQQYEQEKKDQRDAVCDAVLDQAIEGEA